MARRLLIAIAALALIACSRSPQDAMREAATTMGATNLKSIQYSGSGSSFVPAQSFSPGGDGPRFNIKNYTRVVSYDDQFSREELVRTQAENPPRGGAQQPIIGEQKQVFVVSGDYAWNVQGENPAAAPALVEERKTQIWLTPHGFLKAAMANNATAVSQTEGGKTVTAVSFTAPGKNKFTGTINHQNLVEKVETRIPSPVLGDMLVETRFSDYKDYNGVKFPTKIQQSQGGHPFLDITVSDVQPNVNADREVPQTVRSATAPPMKVESQRLADGVWFVAGGSHNSLAVEFKDFIAIVEAPLNEARSLAVIDEAKKLIPNKPIRYLVNTHHHFDHSGGLRTYVAEGATIITHEKNRPFYEEAFKAQATVMPDKLSQSPKPPNFEVLTDKHVLTDGSRTMEIHLLEGNMHNEAMLVAYLPKERILVQADMFTPLPPNAPPPASPNANALNLRENIQRLKLNVARIVPIHGQVATMADLQRDTGTAR